LGSLRDDLAAAIGECRETHISWVFLGGGEVFKVKKPVVFGFLDFGTLDKRRAACEAEDALNRRLAPDVYRGVVPVTRDASGRHAVGGAGEVVDWAVRMRRLPDETRADRLLERGRLDPTALRRVAATLAEFHARARCDAHTAAFGSVDAIRRNVAENFAQSRRYPVPGVTPALVRAVRRWQDRFLAERSAVFEARREAGRVRDGHGDLRLDQMYRERDRFLVLDCIDFNERFRYEDVASDIAFLSMDVRSRKRADLAEIFLAAYARAAGDYGLYRVVDFYESYRAHVRSKVAAILAHDPGTDPALRDAARSDARRYLLLARAAGRPPLVPPRLTAVGGLIAAGKSTVAEALGERGAAPVVDSDSTRKRLFGRSPETPLLAPAWAGAYSEETTRRVYAALFEAADGILESGRPVVLDASFRSREMRREARRLARRRRVPFLFVECRAYPEVCRARLRARANRPGISDAREPLWDEFAARWEPVDDLPPGEHVVLDTDRPLTGARLDRLPAPG
jgi:hypothetical protein